MGEVESEVWTMHENDKYQIEGKRGLWGRRRPECGGASASSVMFSFFQIGVNTENVKMGRSGSRPRADYYIILYTFLNA